MVIIKDYLAGLIKNDKREDGRKLNQFRKIEIIKNPLFNACGSARVKMGETDVIVGVMMDASKPFPDSPDQGILMVNSELSPLASADFELGPPKDDAIELARVIDRAIRESHVIDVDKLCIEAKEKVWTVFVDIEPINADGNLFDACALAAMVALSNTKFPKYDKKEGKVIFGEFSNEKLPLNAEPILCTFYKVNEQLFIDPTAREETIVDARLSIATTKDGHIHAMQKGGIGTFTEDEIFKIYEMAKEKGNELRKYL